MQASPLQLKKLYFVRTVVESSCDIADKDRVKGPTFDFSNVILATETGIGVAEAKEGEDQDYLVDLTIKLDPEKQPRKIPYKLDIRAIGLIKASYKIPKDKRGNLVTINGLAIVYGAIREMVTNLTARYQDGALTLPSVNFLDHENLSADSGAETKNIIFAGSDE